jgi:hypothetical protein
MKLRQKAMKYGKRLGTAGAGAVAFLTSTAYAAAPDLTTVTTELDSWKDAAVGIGTTILVIVAVLAGFVVAGKVINGMKRGG